MISGDSGDYEYLTEAVQSAKDVKGICVEIGLRAGEGTKTIIDACVERRPGSTVISIDPFGSILYIGREMDGPCRLDYTNEMYKQVLCDMSSYVLDKNVNWIPFKMTDTQFFRRFSDGVPMYDLEESIETKYAVIHFDGPHYIEAILKEIEFFLHRTSVGGVWVFDDITPDFYDHEPIHQWIMERGFKHIKTGNKKAMYKKMIFYYEH